MAEKKEKSPILVVLTIMFLAMFIILPPLFRAVVPKEVKGEVINKKAHILSCEAISFAENMKIISKTVYEDNKAVKNTLSYITYSPTTEEITNNANTFDTSMSALNAIPYFKAISGVSVTESSDRTVVVITSDNVRENPDQVGLSNYLLSNDEQTAYFEERGFACSKIEL